MALVDCASLVHPTSSVFQSFLRRSLSTFFQESKPMNKQAPEIQTNRASAGKVRRLLLAVTVVATIGGCAGGIQEDPSGANAVTVKPG
jgi:hypothetical protein